MTESSWLCTSTDQGVSWRTTYVDFGSALLIDRNVPTRVFGGEMLRGVKTGGVYISYDGGQSFQFDGLAGNQITALALNGASTLLFAVAYGSGVYRRSI